MNRKLILSLAAAVLLANAAVAEKQASAAGTDLAFKPVAEQTIDFIGYYKSIQLTPEQQEIKTTALLPLKAVCCEGFSALTCCCPCNFSKSLWGMTHYLIAEKKYNAQQVRDAAKAWIVYVNPDGFSGDVCQTGGCSRAFANNGCGGMDDSAVVF